MSIRTTVTLEDDVLDRVKTISRERGESFKDTLNELLRTAILQVQQKSNAPKFRIKAYPMGRKANLNYDDIESLLSYAEGEDHR
jgi:hypothetical protein